jgi:hypothetical protein
MPRRTRKRWAIAAGVAVCWAALLFKTGSVVAGTALLVLLLALAAGCVLAFRAAGVNKGHPWVERVRSRPWRDGQDVLQLALRHLSDVFVMTPSGSLLAPNAVELRMNPHDYGSLSDLMDIAMINISAAEVYQEQAAAHAAQFARPGPAGVAVMSDPAVPPGRYQFRQARPQDQAAVPADQGFALAEAPAQAAYASAGQPGAECAGADYAGAEHAGAGYAGGQYQGVGAWPWARDGGTRAEADRPTTAGPGTPTVAERGQVPLLRLVTGEYRVETKVSGARAGRGEVELVLPGVDTVSREHARFTFEDGEWWVTNLGRNGVTLNGKKLAGQRPVRDGDSIRWGGNSDSLVSRVEIR